jgi:hypothetical protein
MKYILMLFIASTTTLIIGIVIGKQGALKCRRSGRTYPDARGIDIGVDIGATGVLGIFASICMYIGYLLA